METYSPIQLSGMAFVNASGFLGVELPYLDFAIFAPDPLLGSARFLRLHRQLMRSGLRAVMMEHHADTMPEHFKRGGRERYGYKPRTPATQAIKLKKFRHAIDLVESGKTRRSMLNRVPNVQLRGSPDNVLTGTMRFPFPFPVSRDAKDPRHVTMANMADEIARMTMPEKRAAVERLAALYAADLRHELATRPKIRADIEKSSLV